jgi:hypothetical protein
MGLTAERLSSVRSEGGQDYGQQKSQPFEWATEVVAGGGEDGVGGVAVGPGEVVSAHPMLGIGVTDESPVKNAFRRV